MPRPLGYPITIAFGVTQNVQWKSFELKATSGEVLPITTSEKSWMRSNAIIPLQPLASGQTYTATVSATDDGKPLTKAWSFTTG